MAFDPRRATIIEEPGLPRLRPDFRSGDIMKGGIDNECRTSLEPTPGL
jgi:hypothetical protein